MPTEPSTHKLLAMLQFLSECEDLQLDFRIAGAPLLYSYSGNLQGPPHAHALGEWQFITGLEEQFSISLEFDRCDSFELGDNEVVARSAGHMVRIFAIPPGEDR